MVLLREGCSDKGNSPRELPNKYYVSLSVWPTTGFMDLPFADFVRLRRLFCRSFCYFRPFSIFVQAFFRRFKGHGKILWMKGTGFSPLSKRQDEPASAAEGTA